MQVGAFPRLDTLFCVFSGRKLLTTCFYDSNQLKQKSTFVFLWDFALNCFLNTTRVTYNLEDVHCAYLFRMFMLYVWASLCLFLETPSMKQTGAHELGPESRHILKMKIKTSSRLNWSCQKRLRIVSNLKKSMSVLDLNSQPHGW